MKELTENKYRNLKVTTAEAVLSLEAVFDAIPVKAGTTRPGGTLSKSRSFAFDNNLTNYPNERDFWQNVNKNLSTALFTHPIPSTSIEYNLTKVVNLLKADIDVQLSGSIPYSRTSSVTRAPGANGKLGFARSFAFDD